MMLKCKFIFWGIVSVLCGITSLLPQAARAQMVKDEVNTRIETGYKHMMAGNYEKADKEFRDVLDNAASLPPDICYYFGLNSYYLGKYKQSINWLNKYIELKGTGGQFFEECEKHLDLAEEAYRKEQKIISDDNPEVADSVGNFSIFKNPQEIIDCERVGKVICPVCKGKGVVIREGLFGKEFYTCPYGDEYGYMSCEDYNLLLRGKLEPKKRD